MDQYFSYEIIFYMAIEKVQSTVNQENHPFSLMRYSGLLLNNSIRYLIRYEIRKNIHMYQ